MKTSFTYSYPDYAALIKALARHGKYAKLSKFVFWGIVLLNILASAFFIYDSLSNGYRIGIQHFFNAGLALLILILNFFVRPLYLKRYYKKQMIDGKQVDIEFTDDGVAIDMPNYKGKHEWSAIIRVDQEPEHFLLWINKVQAYCVPKRGFGNEEDMEAFKQLVGSKVAHQELTDE